MEDLCESLMASDTPVGEPIDSEHTGQQEHPSDLELSEAIQSQEETEDEDDEDEIKHFFNLMNKAERRNQRKQIQKKNQFSGPKSDWRRPELGDPDEDTTDTEDDDDNKETQKFLGLIHNATAKTKQHQKLKGNMVNVKWQNGRVTVTNLPPNIRVTRVPAGEDDIRKQEDLLIERRKEMAKRQQITTSCVGGKRKFEDRMTLTEAKVGDFQDTKDYVDFIQTKLKNVNIKLIK